MLSTEDVIGHLRARGLLDASDVVDGDVRVVDASRRNRDFRVVRTGRPSLFVKQGTARDGTSTTAREARVYRLLAERAAGGAGYPHAPRALDWDADEHVLVVELVTGAVDLREQQSRRRRPSVRAAAALGAALGALHAAVPVDAALAEVGEGEPGVMSAQRPGLALLAEFSGAVIDLVRMLQADAAAGEQLDDLHRAWRDDALVHHDVRWDNVLVRPDGALVLVDWETAAVGDRAWDVGCALGEHLSAWLLSVPSSGREPPERSLHLARLPLQDCQPATRALWRAYRTAAAVPDDAAAAELLARATRYAGLKLVQAGLEQSQGTSRPTVAAVCHLQVGVNVMARPADAARLLLGVEAA